MKRIFVAIAILFVGDLGPVFAQRTATELNLMYGKCWIKDDGLGNPAGFNFNLLQQVSRKTNLKFGYTTSRGDDRRYGYFYSGYHDPYPEMRVY